MKLQHFLTLKDCEVAASRLVANLGIPAGSAIYGIPRGGIVPAYMVAKACSGCVTDCLQHADFVIDDVVQTGSTFEKVLLSLEGTKNKNPGFGALFSNQHPTNWEHGSMMDNKTWLVFPWEVGDKNHSKSDTVIRMLEAIGEDPTRGGLLDTPHRVVKAWGEWFSGYAETDPGQHLRTFEDGAEDMDQMIILPPIQIFSHCEHHMAPFFGHAYVGYIPDGRIVGLSKFSKVVNAYARRLQVQERITTQVANCINETLRPKGVGVFIEAQHLCMCSRGIKGPLGKGTKTSALRGCFTEDTVKTEFHRLIAL